MGAPMFLQSIRMVDDYYMIPRTISSSFSVAAVVTHVYKNAISLFHSMSHMSLSMKQSA